MSPQERAAEAYIVMARKTTYRPQYFPGVPGLAREARSYGANFALEESTCKFHLGCADSKDTQALVYMVEAARVLCGMGSPALIRQLLNLALAEVPK